MSEFHYALGLDIGIASVGWAVLQNGADGEPIRVQDLGVRVFDKAEQPKTGASLALPRREARSTRRRLRRHRHRLERIRWLLERCGILSVGEIDVMYAAGGFAKSPYQLRAEALDRPLTKEEAVRVLIHLAQRRGYQSNSTAEAARNEKETGKVKAAIAENRRCMEQHGYRTVGEMMFRDERFWQTHPDGTRFHQPRNKAEDYRFTVERAAVLEEIHTIFAAQRQLGADWMSETLEAAYTDIFASQRSFDEGPGGDSPFGGGLSGKVGFCTFEKTEHRAAKATYTFEYFKLLQDLNHMRIASAETGPRPLNPEERELLKTAALQSASLSFAQLRKKLSLDDGAYFVGLFYGGKSREEAEKRKWPQMQSYHKLRQALDKISKGAISALTTEQLDDIGTILTLYKSDARRLEQLRKAGISELYHPALLPLSFSKFGSLSLQAMRKLMPLLEQGMRYDEACKQIYGDHRGLHSDQRKAKLSICDLEDEITNPVVRRAVSQTIKVVNAVVRTYGPPDVVRVELAREMSRNFDERKKMEKQQEESRTKNERAREQIVEYKRDRATGLDIVKFRLFWEQYGVCLYSGRNLDISRLFEPGYVDVDHVIPYSRCFDDSYRNKVLVLTSENRQKGNRLPYEYFGQDRARWHDYEARVERLIGDYRKRQRLLKKHFTEEESREFIDRNLKDTQYITRAVYNLLRNHLIFAESRYRKQPVQAVNGAVTAMLRNRWGVHKIREDGDLHHCLDAAVVAATSPGLTQRLTEYSKKKETLIETPTGYVDPTTGELVEHCDEAQRDRFPKPWPLFHQELEARLSPDPRHEITRLHLFTYESDEELRPVFVSRMPNHKVTGPAHAETIRSGKGGEGWTVSKKSLTELKLDKNGEIEGYYNRGSDTLLYDALRQRLLAFGGDGKKAFAEPFYKPKHDGTPGPLVRKVKIKEKSTTNLAVRSGIAANGDMLRIDVFHVEDDGYYFVPIYVADTKKPELPNKAAVAMKPYDKWKEMDEKNFLFSLYPGDLVRIRSRKGVTLNLAKGGTGERTIVRQDGMYYYRSAGIAVAQIHVETHDRSYAQPSLGLKTLQSIEKYQVDVLGHYHKVTLPEKRMPFSRED